METAEAVQDIGAPDHTPLKQGVNGSSINTWFGSPARIAVGCARVAGLLIRRWTFASGLGLESGRRNREIREIRELGRSRGVAYRVEALGGAAHGRFRDLKFQRGASGDDLSCHETR